MGGGRCALHHPWILYGSLLTSSQSREGPGADSKHWAWGTFPAPSTHISPPKAGKWQRGEGSTCQPPAWGPSLADGKNYRAWLFTNTGPSHPWWGAYPKGPADPSLVSGPLLAFLRGSEASGPSGERWKGAWTTGMLLVLWVG